MTAWLRAGIRVCGIGLLLAVGSPAVADTGDEESDSLGWWRALLAVGDGASGDVLLRTDAARNSMVAFGSNLEVDEASIGLMDRIREAGLELDLGGLYKLLPIAGGEAHSLRMHGRPEGDARYKWTLFPQGETKNDGRMFAVDGLSQLQPVEHDIGKGKGFAVHQELELGVGPWRHGDVAAVFEAFLGELEASARAAPDAALVAQVREHQSKLVSDADLALAAGMLQAAPEFTGTLSQIVRVDRVAELSDHGLDVDFVGRLDLAGLRGLGYDSLAKYIDKLDNLLVLDMSVRDGNGLPLVVVGFYSAGPGLRVAFTTKDGALLARRRGVPDPTRAVRPTQDVVNLKIRTDIEIRAEGMLLRISDYEIPVLYRSSGGGADVSVPIQTEPKVEFTGQGKLTSWIAEIADSALNLEYHGQVIFKAVAAGVDGTGSQASVRYDDSATAGVMSGSLDLLLVDNALVRMGFRIVGRHLTPNDTVVGEGMHLAGRLIRDLDTDYGAIRDDLLTWGG